MAKRSSEKPDDPLTEEEVLGAFKGQGLSATQVAVIVSLERVSKDMTPVNRGKVSYLLQQMEAALKPKIVADRSKSPIRYSLKLQEKGANMSEDKATDDGKAEDLVPPRDSSATEPPKENGGRENEGFTEETASPSKRRLVFKIFHTIQGGWGFPKDKQRPLAELFSSRMSALLAWRNEATELLEKGAAELEAKRQQEIEEAVKKYVTSAVADLESRIAELERYKVSSVPVLESLEGRFRGLVGHVNQALADITLSAPSAAPASIVVPPRSDGEPKLTSMQVLIAGVVLAIVVAIMISL